MKKDTFYNRVVYQRRLFKRIFEEYPGPNVQLSLVRHKENDEKTGPDKEGFLVVRTSSDPEEFFLGSDPVGIHIARSDLEQYLHRLQELDKETDAHTDSS